MNHLVSFFAAHRKLTRATLSIAIALAIVSLWWPISVLDTLAQGTEIQQMEGQVAIQQAQNIELVSQIGGNIDGVAVSGKYAYLAASNAGLRIFSVANPATPVEVGSHNTPGEAEGIAVVGNYAYVADGGGGLRIINIANRAAPVEAGSCNTTGYAWEVAVQGNYAYVAASYSGLRIIDISNPLRPTEKSSFDTPGEAWDIAVSGNYAYIADHQGGLRIINISNPAAPTAAGSYGTAGLAWGVAVSGNYAYVAHGLGLSIIDITNPMAPFQAGSYPTGYSNGLTVIGNYAYVTSVGLQIIKIADPTAPVKVASYSTSASARDVVVAGKYAYVVQLNTALLVLWGVPQVSGFVPPLQVGILTSPTDNTVYTFPAGTFTETTVVTHSDRFPGNVPSLGNLIGIDHVFDITATYSETGQSAQPAQPFTITVQYTEAEKGPAIESTLALYYWNGSQWEKEPSSVVDSDTNTVSAELNHLSLWAILGETRRVFLPVVMRQ